MSDAALAPAAALESIDGRDRIPESDCWRTPPALFEALDREVGGFRCDLAANADNALVRTSWLGPGSGGDALALDWSALWGPLYLNPPYSQTGVWVRRAAAAAAAAAETPGLPTPGRPWSLVALLPYMPSESWWAAVETAVEIRRIPHRLKFVRADGQTQTTARFPSCVVVWRPQPGIVQPAPPRYVTWTFRPAKESQS